MTDASEHIGESHWRFLVSLLFLFVFQSMFGKYDRTSLLLRLGNGGKQFGFEIRIPYFLLLVLLLVETENVKMYNLAQA